MNSPAPTPSNPPDLSWDVVVKFVRQLSHDLRNHLNAVELQAAFLGEIATDKEVKDEVKRLREMLGSATGALQKLSSDLGHARLNTIPYKAIDFVEDLRQKLSASTPAGAAAIEWTVKIGDVTLDLDPQLLSLAILELVDNARRFSSGGPLGISAITEGTDRLVLSLSEPKSEAPPDLSNWGREPLKTISHGHYGLGLNRARIIVESHGGQLEATYDSQAKKLVTRITLPARATG